MIRPEILAALARWREVMIGAAITLPGLWIMSFGGFFWIGVGLLIVGVGAAFVVNALRRMRFRGASGAPGLVRIVEGQVAYFGPEEGGFAAMDELEELRLAPAPDGPHWELVQPDGTLRIPAHAEGAEQLFDLLATLPGIDMAHVLATLEAAPAYPRTVWRRRAHRALT